MRRCFSENWQSLDELPTDSNSSVAIGYSQIDNLPPHRPMTSDILARKLKRFHPSGAFSYRL